MLTLSSTGVKALISEEGEVLESYQDVAGVWTVGVGNTSHAGPGVTISKKKSRELLKKDVGIAEDIVRKKVHVELTQAQFDALVSFTYNVGTGAFSRSTLLKKLNRGDYLGAADEFLKWTKVTKDGKKVVINGLVARRARERSMFLSGVEVHSTDDLNLESNLEPAPLKKTISPTKEGVVVSGGAVGLAGLNAVKDQIEPLTSYSETIQWVFVAISVVGVLAYLWYSRKEN